MLNFSQHQDVARRRSRRMYVVLVGAVVGTIAVTAVSFAGVATLLALAQVVATTDFEVQPAHWLGVFGTWFCLAMVLAGGIVIGVAVHRTLRALASGGIEVARQLGGKRVMTVGHDQQYQQLINVVEELAIASGTAAPKIFVLEEEPSINAFAAGIEPGDTVVGVTRGALEHFSRSQLQGVLAHEFSHIVNRDTRINVQTLGALQGIEAIGSAAAYLLRMGVGSRVHGSMLATVFGCVLWPVGQIGLLFGSLARMALNRQREYLADAAAVQFTRYPEGLSSALKLIAAHACHGRIAAGAAQSASHFFFAEGSPALGRLLRSHPPIDARIRRLDPEWDGTLAMPLPAQSTTLLDPRERDQCRDEVERAAPRTPTMTASERAAVTPSLGTSAPMPPGVPELHETSPTTYSHVSEADRQAFLESLARVRAASTRQEYRSHVTHLPTLAATAAAVFVAVILFSWLTRR